MQYTWDFGDGNVTIVTSATVTHSYPLDGNYTVQLTVTDNNGQTGTAAAVVQVQEDVNFRVCFYGTVIPMPNVQVTVYYYNGTAYVPIPARAGSPGVNTEYDNVTQPKEVGTGQYRNPAFTASILLNKATNIEFDVHRASMDVFFKFQWGPYVAYWPNSTDTFYRYVNGNAVANNFGPCEKPYYDSKAGTYVIEAADIKSGESREGQPIIASILCPPPTQQFYLNVNTNPSGITTIPGQGLYTSGTNVTLTAPADVTVSSNTQYRFNYWDVDGASLGSGVNPITVLMNANHTVTAHYVMQYFLTVSSPYDSPSPLSGWFDSGTGITESVTSPVSGGSGIQYICTGWSGNGSVPSSGSASSVTFTISAPSTITWNWKTQYYLTVSSAYDSPSPVSGWFDSGKSIAESVSSPVSGGSGVQYVCTGWSGSGSIPASGSASSVSFTISQASTITWNWKTQYHVTFDQTGVGSDFTGTVVTVDSLNYNVTGLPFSFWWDSSSSHSYSFAAPLVVNGKQYTWSSTSGLSTSQSGTLTITASGNVVGNYIVQNSITFDQMGVGSDYSGTMLIVDGASYNVAALPVSFAWNVGSVHNFTYQSPLIVGANSEQYVWTGTTGLSSSQSGSITVATYGSIIGNYKTQYYLTVSSAYDSPSPVSGWFDSGKSITESVSSPVSGGSGVQYVCTGWSGSGSIPVSGSVSSVTFTIGAPSSVAWNWKTQYQVTFSESGVGSDFTGTVVTIDSNAYTVSSLPVSFWWDSGSVHTFSFSSPLTVNASEQYSWVSTSGLTTVQNGYLTVTGSGSVTGNYSTEIEYQLTFSLSGVGSDFTGTVVTIDSNAYTVSSLPVSFWWGSGSVHTFSFSSPLVVTANAEQYVWAGTSGLSTLQGDTITVTASGSVTGSYNMQYYLTLATNPSGVTSPIGAGWYNAGTNATVSTDAFVTITAGSSRYRFNGWTTGDMTEISNYLATPTTVLVDQAKTVTATYAVQYNVTFNQLGVGSDFTDTVAVIDGANYTATNLPVSFWWDSSTVHTFAFQSPLVAIPNAEAYGWTSTTGLLSIQAGTLTVSASGSMIGNYATQYYLTVTSPYASPTPASGWFNAGTGITASVTSPASGPTGTQYVCTGWSGTGSVPTSGSGTTTSFTITQASTIAWNWKTQYYLTVQTIPSPLVTISGQGWYDASSSVPLNAPSVTGWTFLSWDIDGTSQGSTNPITVSMGTAHTATAHYTSGQPLNVSINPMFATVTVGAALHFTSNATGGTPPYTYQWYLNGNPVTGATSSTWTFVPPAAGMYYIYLQITDASHSTTQSGTASIEVILPSPVGGFSISMEKLTPLSYFGAYMGLLALFGTVLCMKKRKRK